MKLIYFLILAGLFSCNNSSKTINTSDFIGKVYVDLDEIEGLRDFKPSLSKGKISIYRNRHSGLIIIESKTHGKSKCIKNFLFIEDINSNTNFDIGVCHKGTADESIMVIQTEGVLMSSKISNVILIDTTRNVFTRKSFEEARECFSELTADKLSD